MKTVVGLFDSFPEAQNAVSQLESAGVSRDHISVVAHESAASGAHGSHGHSAGDAVVGAATGAVEGAGKGAVIGGLTGLAASLAMLAIPGVGPVLAMGPLSATLTGASIGAMGGGVIGGLTGLGVPDEDANYYAEGVRRGGTLVTASVPDEHVQTAVAILDRSGAVDIDQRGAQLRSSGYTGFNPQAQPLTHEEILRERQTYQTAPASATTAAAASTAAPQTLNATDQVAIPVVEEQLQVGKREVEKGRVRVYTRITEQPVEEQVTLREEHVNVERHPVDRAVNAADMDAFKEGTIELRETAEEAVVAKQARVVEEVVINKEATQHTETVRDTVRRTDVDVQEVDTATVTSTSTNATTRSNS